MPDSYDYRTPLARVTDLDERDDMHRSFLATQETVTENLPTNYVARTVLPRNYFLKAA